MSRSYLIRGMSDNMKSLTPLKEDFLLLIFPERMGHTMPCKPHEEVSYSFRRQRKSIGTPLLGFC